MLIFAVAPWELPVKELIRGVEQAVGVLPVWGTDEVRNEVCHILKTVRVANTSTSQVEWEALPSLRKNENLVA